MSVSFGRWWLSIGRSDWRNYVSLKLAGVLAGFEIVFGHFQLTSSLHWKPRRPRFYQLYFFRRVLDSKRWTSHAIGIDAWPITLGLHWHATCYGCVSEYINDYDAYRACRAVKP